MKPVIVDIDGTVAKMNEERLKFITQDRKDWDKFYEMCFQDEPITDIIQLVHELWQAGHDIVFCTSRRESVREITVEWLLKYFDHFMISDCILLMRPEGDKRQDTDIKPEQLKDIDLNPENVFLILEDRNQMINEWRRLGYRCLQVQKGDF